MRKLVLKNSLLLILWLIILIHISSLFFSYTLNLYCPQIKKYLIQITDLELDFNYLSFTILNGVKLSNVILKESGSKLIEIRALCLHFSLPHILKKIIALNKVVIIDAKLSQKIVKHSYFLREKLNLLIQTSQALLTLGTLRISTKIPPTYIKNLKISRVNFSENDFIRMNLKLFPYLENITCFGIIDFANSRLKKAILDKFTFFSYINDINFFIEIALTKEDCLVNNLRLSSKNFNIIGAGIVYNYLTNPIFDVKLFSMPLELKELVRLKPKLILNGLINIVANLKGYSRKLFFQTEVSSKYINLYLSQKILRLSNIVCNLNFRNNQIIIKELTLIIGNRFPVFITGTIRNFLNPEFDLTMKTTIPKVGLAEKEKISLIISQKSRLDQGKLQGKLLLLLTEEMQDRQKSYPLNKLLVKLDNFSFVLERVIKEKPEKKPAYKIDFNIQNISVFAADNRELDTGSVPKIELTDLTSQFIFRDGQFAIKELNCLGYSGKIAIMGLVDFVRLPTYNFVIKLDKIGLKEIEAIFPTKLDIDGFVSGIINFNNLHRDFAKGIIRIDDASVTNVELVNNIADFLNVNSLKNIRNAKLAIEFFGNLDNLEIRELQLTSPGLDSQANFVINSKKWLQGEIHLNLSKKTLEESHIFQSLFAMIEEKDPRIDFDFRLSGYPGALRFQFMEGEFREKLIQKLSRTVKLQLENEINKVIGSFPE